MHHLQYEAIYWVGWLIKLYMFQQVSRYRLKPYLFLLIPSLFTLLEYWNYNFVFWGEIFFLPIIALLIKKREKWSLLQYLFYCFFTLTIYDLFSSLASIYFQFLFHLSEDVVENNVWLDWIPVLLTLPGYIIFLKIIRMDIETLAKGIRNNKLLRVIQLFTATLIIYYLCTYVLLSLPTLEEEGWFTQAINERYYNRIVVFSYIPIFLGFLLYIQYIVRENMDRAMQKSKDAQIASISEYSQHIEVLYKEIRSFRHDYTNILVSLNESIKKRDIDGIESVYNTVLSDSDKTFYDSQYDIADLSHLENVAMKSIVSAKMIEAQSKGVHISIEIEESISAPSSIELIDFLKILSIFLDNALEAALQAENPAIAFVYFQEENQKILIIENTTKALKINTKKIFEYGYSDKGENRGIGLANVREILLTNKNISLRTYSENHHFRQELQFQEKY